MCVCVLVCVCIYILSVPHLNVLSVPSGSRWEIMANFELKILSWETVDRQQSS